MYKKCLARNRRENKLKVNRSESIKFSQKFEFLDNNSPFISHCFSSSLLISIPTGILKAAIVFPFVSGPQTRKRKLSAIKTSGTLCPLFNGNRINYKSLVCYSHLISYLKLDYFVGWRVPIKLVFPPRCIFPPILVSV